MYSSVFWVYFEKFRILCITSVLWVSCDRYMYHTVFEMYPARSHKVVFGKMYQTVFCMYYNVSSPVIPDSLWHTLMRTNTREYAHKYDCHVVSHRTCGIHPNTSRIHQDTCILRHCNTAAQKHVRYEPNTQQDVYSVRSSAEHRKTL